MPRTSPDFDPGLGGSLISIKAALPALGYKDISNKCSGKSWYAPSPSSKAIRTRRAGICATRLPTLMPPQPEMPDIASIGSISQQATFRCCERRRNSRARRFLLTSQAPGMLSSRPSISRLIFPLWLATMPALLTRAGRLLVAGIGPLAGAAHSGQIKQRRPGSARQTEGCPSSVRRRAIMYGGNERAYSG